MSSPLRGRRASASLRASWPQARGTALSRRRASAGRQSAVDRGGGEFGAVGGIELGEDVREVRLHRAAAHEKAGTDLRVGEAFGDEADDFELGRGEARPAGGGPAPPAAERIPFNWHIIHASIELVSATLHIRRLFLAILSISFFWTIGAVLIIIFPPLVKNVLGANEQVASLFIAIFSVGIAIGSVTINRLLRSQVTMQMINTRDTIERNPPLKTKKLALGPRTRPASSPMKDGDMSAATGPRRRPVPRLANIGHKRSRSSNSPKRVGHFD